MMGIIERKKKERRKEIYVHIICKRKSVNYKRMTIVNVLSHMTSNWTMAVFNPITVDNYAAFFNCTPVGRASDSMMAPT